MLKWSIRGARILMWRRSFLISLASALALAQLSMCPAQATISLFQRLLTNPRALLATPPLTLTEVSLDYKWFKPGGFDPLINYNGIPGKEPGGQVDLHVNMDVLNYLYFNNMVHSLIDRDVGGSYGQFRVIGWNFQIGVHLSQYADIYMEHFSQHLLDTTYQDGHPPVVDSFGVKVYLWRDQPAKNTVLP